MGKGISFAGRSIIKPGAYAVVNADALVPNRLGAANTIGVIGTALGSRPQTIQTINSPLDASRQLRGGVLLDLINLMYDPSPQVPGAGQVRYYRLNLATQAALNLQSSAAANVILLTSLDYGVWTNQIRIKVEAGSVSGLKVTLNDVMTPTVLEVGDNLGNAFSIQYVGTGQYAAFLTITKIGDLATSLTLQTQATGTAGLVTILSVDLTNPSVSTMGQLAAYLASQANLMVTILGDPNEPVSDLDAVTGQNILTAVYTATAAIGAIVNWINTNSRLATAARVAGATAAPALVAYTFLAGGSEGALPTNADWQNAINAFANVDIQFLVVASDQAAIHAMALAHCEAMSDVKVRKERVCVVGGALGETVQQAVARAQGLADKRAALCYPGIQRRDLITGNVDLLEPMYAAALVAGMKGGVTPEVSMTFKTINVIGLEKTLALADIESLLNGQVLIFEPAPQGGFRIVQDLTTYLVDDNVVWRKGFGVRIADYLNSQLRDAVNRYVGGVADQSTVLAILGAAASRLRQLTRTPANLTGVLTAGVNQDTGRPEPAFKNLTAVFDGFDLVAITYEAHPVGEVAYITITAGLTPTTIVAKQ